MGWNIGCKTRCNIGCKTWHVILHRNIGATLGAKLDAKKYINQDGIVGANLDAKKDVMPKTICNSRWKIWFSLGCKIIR